MGFYAPAVLVKDAQRHGLRVKPIDIQSSEWPCTIEHRPMAHWLYAWVLAMQKDCEVSCRRHDSSRRHDGHFTSIGDFVLSVPSLQKKELSLLAGCRSSQHNPGVEHRRDALWQVERAGKLEGPLLLQNSRWPAGASHPASCPDEHGGAPCRGLLWNRFHRGETSYVLPAPRAAPEQDSLCSRFADTP